ncbi:MAG: hypothetical protein H6Q10_344, partial [Acidobacteria bacterium]|nr:hypothetical protein [Acidobacteriota bacterium]
GRPGQRSLKRPAVSVEVAPVARRRFTTGGGRQRTGLDRFPTESLPEV